MYSGGGCIFNFADGAVGGRGGERWEGRAEREATAIVGISQDVSVVGWKRVRVRMERVGEGRVYLIEGRE